MVYQSMKIYAKYCDKTLQVNIFKKIAVRYLPVSQVSNSQHEHLALRRGTGNFEVRTSLLLNGDCRV